MAQPAAESELGDEAHTISRDVQFQSSCGCGHVLWDI